MRWTRRLTLTTTLAAAALAIPLHAAAVAVGEAAPAFELKDTQGKTVKLSDFKGKHVVLEWTNPGCPFVVKHYGAKNMQALQKDAKAKDVVWLSINSTARGHHDHLAPTALQDKLVKDWGATPTAVLMDEAGTAGKAYAARTTPHMYVIDPAGKLVYAGGIDDKRSANPADIPGAKNFVRAALADSLAGKPVATPSTPPYGCSIKYDAS
ncbi:thioredoxin family protein [Pseudaquabacterium pictum]|uniref:Thioredoxin family protein n=1 Tax=Pseudaquabacterium pictum TaxID=2315236 RepID=A0A480AQA4_9BURK|nr:thioredoxin family protein [Rubrivivax pictus]GCL63611.1 thioredoxin family protein [Rubrivivax pictus]